MDIYKTTLAQNYKNKTDKELLDLHATGALTAIAYDLLEAELYSRGIAIPERHKEIKAIHGKSFVVATKLVAQIPAGFKVIENEFEHQENKVENAVQKISLVLGPNNVQLNVKTQAETCFFPLRYSLQTPYIKRKGHNTNNQEMSYGNTKLLLRIFQKRSNIITQNGWQLTIGTLCS